MYKLLYFENKKTIFITNFKNKNFLSFFIPTKEVTIYYKILRYKSLLYHFDSSILHTNVIKNFQYIMIINSYLKNYNYFFYTNKIYKKILFNSSSWINREMCDMFGSYSYSKNIDNRKLLIDYNFKRGVLIYCLI